MIVIRILTACAFAAGALGLGCSQTPTTTSTAASAVAEPLSAERYHADFLRPMFSVLDCEGVGVVDSGEVDEHFYDVYFYFDRDQSRTILPAEFSNGAHLESATAATALFTAIDENANGELSPMEYRRYLIGVIEAADRDGDGEVTLAELNQSER